MRAILLFELLSTGFSLSTITPTDYLSSLSSSRPVATAMPVDLPASPKAAPAAPASPPVPPSTRLSHAPLSYFALDKLCPKGPRKNADVGKPHDSTRPLADDCGLSSGSWWCATGGWPSPMPRATTEVFYVLDGHGMLTDADGQRSCFGPGDAVVLPKGWHGRWDILVDVHKVWFVHDHPSSPGQSGPIARAHVTYHKDFLESSTLYDDPRATTVRATAWATGDRLLVAAATHGIHVLDGVFFLTAADGVSATRCAAGDTVLVPRGFAGAVDVVQTARVLVVEAA